MPISNTSNTIDLFNLYVLFSFRGPGRTFINYAYICRGNLKEAVWENKTLKLKRSIGTGLGPAPVTWIAGSHLVTESRICDTGNNKFCSKARKFRK